MQSFSALLDDIRYTSMNRFRRTDRKETETVFIRFFPETTVAVGKSPP